MFDQSRAYYGTPPKMSKGSQDWAGQASPSVVGRMDKCEKKKQEAVFEITTGESKYVDGLSHIEAVYSNVMLTNSFVTASEHLSIFSNLPAIAKAHAELNEMFKRARTGEGIANMGEMVVDWVSAAVKTGRTVPPTLQPWCTRVLSPRSWGLQRRLSSIDRQPSPSFCGPPSSSLHVQFQQWELEKEYGIYCANLAYGKHVLRKVIQKYKVNKDGRFEAFLQATTTLKKSQRQMLQDMLDAPRRRLQNYKLLLVAVRKFTDDRKWHLPHPHPHPHPHPLSPSSVTVVTYLSANGVTSACARHLPLLSLCQPPTVAPYAQTPPCSYSRIETELPDAGHLDHAIQLLTGACHEVDKVVRDKGRDRIVAIQESIDMQHVNSWQRVDLVNDNVPLMLEGEATLKDGKPCKIFLFQHMLLITKESKHTPGKVVIVGRPTSLPHLEIESERVASFKGKTRLGEDELACTISIRNNDAVSGTTKGTLRRGLNRISSQTGKSTMIKVRTRCFSNLLPQLWFRALL